MTFLALTFMAVTCLMGTTPLSACPLNADAPQLSTPLTTAPVPPTPERTGEAVDVELTADAALAWDVTTGTILYSRQAEVTRQIASLNKLLSVLTVRANLPMDTVVEIPKEARAAQQAGADIQLPIGEHTSVQDLLAASLIASANDAVVTLAVATSGSEKAFVEEANAYAEKLGLQHTKVANSTGLSGGDQYSNAQDVRQLLTKVYQDPVLRPLLSTKTGELVTVEGKKRTYKTTDKLLGTYVTILAAKTGYTVEAGENLAIITQTPQGHPVGAIILGSQDRFQDMKILLEWLWRNYTWPS